MTDETRRVLIIEDEEAILMVLKQFLTFHEFEVQGAMMGMQGMRLAESFAPNIIILDRMLPDMDGLAILKLLRGRPETKDIPVVILSALSSAKHVEQGYAAGATRYLKKPVDMTRLVKELEAALAIGEHVAPDADTQQADATAEPTGDDVDFVVAPRRDWPEGGDETRPI